MTLQLGSSIAIDLISYLANNLQPRNTDIYTIRNKKMNK